MCGRYTETRGAPELEREFQALNALADYTPRYNIAPTQNAPVVMQNGQRVLTLMRWGLVPHWAQDETIGNKLINARAETLATKPSFKSPFQRQRCLVPADGFYEWLKKGSVRLPMRFVLRDEGPFAFAGLWDRWRTPTHAELLTYTIITTEANDLVRPVHERMPLILPRSAYDLWLDPSVCEPERLQSLLRPYPATQMKSYPVSPVVNSPKLDSPQCIAPLPADQVEFKLASS